MAGSFGARDDDPAGPDFRGDDSSSTVSFTTSVTTDEEDEEAVSTLRRFSSSQRRRGRLTDSMSINSLEGTLVERQREWEEIRARKLDEARALKEKKEIAVCVFFFRSKGKRSK